MENNNHRIIVPRNRFYMAFACACTVIVNLFRYAFYDFSVTVFECESDVGRTKRPCGITYLLKDK